MAEPEHRHAVFVSQRAFPRSARGLHVAIIMDGNGRWARRHGLPRHAGHREGAKAVRAVVERAADPAVGVGTLTLYAFSSDNWKRPSDEVARIMRLFGEYLRRETPRCVENGVRLTVIGRRDRLSARLVREIEASEAATRSGEGLELRMAIDYSAREVLARAAALAADLEAEEATRERFGELVGRAAGGGGPAPDVDLLIRTGGERRLSDFLLWECAYAELYFTPVPWPDFGEAELDRALAEFRRRERRYGGIGDADLEAAV
ncbi:MAG: polyprenyl diphosphate synthase [Gemmatimonadota bacterium]